MVPFVVQHQDRQPVGQVAEHPAGERRRRLRPLVHHPVTHAALDVRRLRGEGVPVGHEHLARREQRPVLQRHQVEGGVVVLRVVRAEDLQPLLDRQVGAADEDAVGVLAAGRVAAAVAERPGDQHRHHHRLAGPGRHLAAQPPQAAVAERRERVPLRRDERRPLAAEHPLQVVLGQFRLEAEAGRPAGQADLGEVDDRLDGLALAEEQPPRAVGPGPVAEQLTADRRGAGVLGRPPLADVGAESVDQRQVFALLLGEQRPLGRAGALGLVVVPGVAAAGHAPGLAGFAVVGPVLGRLVVRAAQDRPPDRLDRHVAGGGWLAHGWYPPLTRRLPA